MAKPAKRLSGKLSLPLVRLPLSVLNAIEKASNVVLLLPKATLVYEKKEGLVDLGNEIKFCDIKIEPLKIDSSKKIIVKSKIRIEFQTNEVDIFYCEVFNSNGSHLTDIPYTPAEEIFTSLWLESRFKKEPIFILKLIKTVGTRHKYNTL